MKKRLIWLCMILALAFAACDNNGTKHQGDDHQQVEQTDLELDPFDLVNDSIEKDETRPDLYLRRASLYMKREQIGMAMMDVNKAVQLDPKNVNALLMLADIYYELGDDVNISATLNKAMEIDPYDTRPMVKMAELNLLQQNFNLAFGYIDNALKVSTFNPKAYFVKGMVYMAKADTASALKNFLIAREQDAGFYDPQHEICKIYQAQGNPLAEGFMRSMVTIFPEEPLSRYELALFLQDNGYPEEALAHYDTLLQVSPGNSRLLFNKGYVYFVYLGENEKALDYFNQSLQGDPGYLDALYNKGHVLEQMGDYVQAKAIYTQVLEQQSSYRLAIEGMNRIANQSRE